MTITAAGTPSPDPGTVPVPTFPFSVSDPVHLAQDDYGEPVYVAWPNATCLSAASPAAASPPPRPSSSRTARYPTAAAWVLVDGNQVQL
jgi:hypothetical protein